MGLVAVTVGFAAGLLLGLAVAPVIADYAEADPSALWQAAGATAVAGLGIFGTYTIFDFNRLRRGVPDSAVMIAASIFLDIFNVFLLLVDLFGGERD